MCKEFFTFHAQRRRKRGWTQIFFMKTKIINLDFPCFQFFLLFLIYTFFTTLSLVTRFSPPSFFQLFFQHFSTHYHPWTTQPTNISRESSRHVSPVSKLKWNWKTFSRLRKKTWSCATWHTCHMVTWSHSRVRDILVTGFRMTFSCHDKVKGSRHILLKFIIQRLSVFSPSSSYQSTDNVK